jgi:hypothetical protein
LLIATLKAQQYSHFLLVRLGEGSFDSTVTSTAPSFCSFNLCLLKGGCAAADIVEAKVGNGPAERVNDFETVAFGL